MINLISEEHYHRQRRKYTFKSEEEKNADPDYRKKRDRNNVLSWKAKQKKAVLLQTLSNENQKIKEKMEMYKKENLLLNNEIENLSQKLEVAKQNLNISNNYIKILEEKLDNFYNYFIINKK
uniref:BZIP domain-containing protein n=1 Tax=Strongyloides venezuelensis TaxID=75913 RepID=A0A0K0G0I7_STRVS